MNRLLALQEEIFNTKKKKTSSVSKIKIDAPYLKKIQEKSPLIKKPNLEHDSATGTANSFYIPVFGKLTRKGELIPVIDKKVKLVSLKKEDGLKIDFTPLAIESKTNAKGEFFLSLKVDSLLNLESVLENCKIIIEVEGQMKFIQVDLINRQEFESEVDDIIENKILKDTLRRVGIYPKNQTLFKYGALKNILVD